MQRVQTFGFVFVVAAMMFAGQGCAALGMGQKRSSGWERAYEGRTQTIVVERFEIDVRNTQALSKVADYYDPDRVVFMNGTAAQIHHDLEMMGVRRGLEYAMRSVSAQRTIRRTTQSTFQFNSHVGTQNDIALPDDARIAELMFFPGNAEDSEGDGQPRMAVGTHIEMELVDRFAEGWEMSLRPRAMMVNGNQPRVLHEFHFFIRPGEAIVLRTYPHKPDAVPGYLRFEHEGQQIETVYLITYSMNR